MIIHGVVVCVHFADFLSTTLPMNRHFFKTLTVVTSPDDLDTKRLAEKHDCRVVVTNTHKDGGAPFNKGKAINAGLQSITDSDWRCHIDADIVLPNISHEALFEKMKQCYTPVFNSVFGIQRKMCESYEAWNHWLTTNDDSVFRLDNVRTHKNLPVGFFQLWHSHNNFLYPEQYETATSSDLEFSRQFGRFRAHLNIHAIHLSSIPHERWTDWKGRTSPRWGKS